jgi:putative endopeptidase
MLVLKFAAPFAFVLSLSMVPFAAHAQSQTGRGIDLSHRDTTCAPCRDFFRYANGAWDDRTPIPAAYSRYGVSREMADRSQEGLHKLLEDAARNVTHAKPGSDEWKLGTFYGSCMDSARAEREGGKPLRPLLDKIDALKAPAELAACVAQLHATGSNAMFRFSSQQDFKNSSEVIAAVGQGGLGLPDRDYYTRPDSASAAIRTQYVAHVAAMLQLIGTPAADAKSDADHIMALETRLAKASMTRVQRRDPHAVYHRMPLDSLAVLAPALEWKVYLKASGVPVVASLNVAQPDFFRALGVTIGDVPLADWKAYLRWHLVQHEAPYLSSAFVDEDFKFQQTLTGVKALLPRWKRCLQATDESLGEILGKEYVRENFTPQARAHALDMVHNLEAALKARLAALPWMNDSTRTQAIAKLAAFDNKIGYPDHWRDYSKLELVPGDGFTNHERAESFEQRRQLGKIGRPVDRGEWGMTTPTVNAYYNPTRNEIVFPAGILQPPYFDPLADDAFNYGSMGAVIGHEMTHGFDDSGRQFDGSGNLHDWWTPADAAHYKAQAQRVSDQFDGFVAVDTLHVNGKLTLGENIADLGGLVVAWDAWRAAAARQAPQPNIDGYTPEQRFFLGYAQSWREKTRPERLRMLIATDPHAPEYWRVNGPLANLPEFAKAFGCKAGDAMVRPDSLRAQIW